MTKKCGKCGELKPYGFFQKRKSSKDGYYNYCKKCMELYHKKHRESNKDKINERSRKWREENKEKTKQYYKEYSQENVEKIKEYRKEYRKTYKTRRNLHNKYRRKTDYIFKFTENIRSLILGSFKRGKNKFKKNARTETILGCTVEEFRLHIEKQFTEGMTFENHGKWHLDHIIPIASANTEEEIIKLNHYTNFQPLWAIDNFKKGSKL